MRHAKSAKGSKADMYLHDIHAGNAKRFSEFANVMLTYIASLPYIKR